MMDIRLYTQMLEIDSTSGRERGLADFLAGRMQTDRNGLRSFDVESMRADTPFLLVGYAEGNLLQSSGYSATIHPTSSLWFVCRRHRR